MATQLFLRNTTPATEPFAFTVRDFSTTRGAAQVGLGELMGDPAVDHELHTTRWVYRVNAFTCSGTITFNWWGWEVAMADNRGFAAIVARYDNSGSFISDVVAQANANHADGVELAVGSPGAVRNWTATPTSTAFADGDWIVLEVHFDCVGACGGAGANEIISIDGPTAAASGDSYVTFTENITEFVAVAAVPRSTPYPQLLAH